MISGMYLVKVNELVYVYFPRITSPEIDCIDSDKKTERVLQKVQSIVFRASCNMMSEFGDYRGPQISDLTLEFDVETIPMQPINLTFFNDGAKEFDLIQQQIEETQKKIRELVEAGERLETDRIFGMKLSEASETLSLTSSIIIILAILGYVVYTCFKRT